MLETNKNIESFIKEVERLSKKIKDIKKNTMEMLELKNMSGIKSPVHGLSRRIKG